MKKKTIAISMCLIMMLSFVDLIGVKAYDNSVMAEYHPYSSWAVSTGAKYKLVMLEDVKRNVKRYELANVIYLLLDLKIDNTANGRFSDINGLDNIKASRIMAINNKGIIKGYEDGNFYPNNDVTRAEFVTMLFRTKMLKKTTSNKTFNFVDIQNHWAKEYIYNVCANEIMSGKSNELFSPDDHITIQEVFVILDRLSSQQYASRDKVIEIMKDTFKCRNYGDDEAYVIEEMYGKYDEIMSKIKYCWFYYWEYDYNDWNTLATYEDLLRVMYTLKFNSKKNLPEELEKEKYDEYLRYFLSIVSIYDIKYEDGYRQEFIDMKNAMTLVSYMIPDYEESNIRYRNIESFPEKYVYCLNSLLKQGIITNSDYPYPADMYVTKYIINYYIVRVCEKRQKVIDCYFNTLKLEESDMPNNVQDLTYVMKEVPNWVYELPLLGKTGPDLYNVRGYFPWGNRYYSSISVLLNSYYDMILNVDYRTINVDEFVTKCTEYLNFDSRYEQAIREYVQYVIDNQIVIKGKGTPLFGFTYLLDGFVRARVILEFEIVNSNTNVNLLIGDNNAFEVVSPNTSIYNEKTYYVCVDNMLEAYLRPPHFYIGGYRKTWKPIFSEKVN